MSRIVKKRFTTSEPVNAGAVVKSNKIVGHITNIDIHQDMMPIDVLGRYDACEVASSRHRFELKIVGVADQETMYKLHELMRNHGGIQLLGAEEETPKATEIAHTAANHEPGQLIQNLLDTVAEAEKAKDPLHAQRIRVQEFELK